MSKKPAAPIASTPAAEDAATQVDPEQPQARSEPAAEPEIRYLDDDGSASCPIPGYTGAIVYPQVMDLTRYQMYRRIVAEMPDEDGALAMAFAVRSDTERIEPVWFSVLYFKLALALARVSIQMPADQRLDDIDTLPVNFVAWLSLTAKEWVTSQLTFRVHPR